MAAHSLLRVRNRGEAKVGTAELFFDLVFVFAVTQISHSLLAHLDATGALQATLMLLATWWVWIYTAWATNWLDPDRIPVRLCLFALMLAGLLMAAALPKAFGTHGLPFAAAYVSMQLGRTAFVLWASRRGARPLRRNFQRVIIWLTLAAAFWIIGAFAEGQARIAWWLLALAIEMASPTFYFWVPGLGRSHTSDWNIDGHHVAERCALFVIIALGESLLVTGATFADRAWTAPAVAALAIAFIGSGAMWWIYFDTSERRATKLISDADNPGRLARNAYTYLHMPIVAGIIVCAVSDELLLVHAARLDTPATAVILGGPALYLLGTGAFKWVTNARPLPPVSHMAGLVLLGMLLVLALSHAVGALTLGALATAVLVLVAVWESLALRRTPRKARTA